MSRLLLGVLATLLCLPIGASAQSYHVSGMVMRVDPALRTLVVSHDSISGLMGAMMMPFTVHDGAELADLAPGVNVEFTLVVEADAAFATAIHIRPYEGLEQDPMTARRLALLKRLTSPAEDSPPAVSVGDVVPEFALVDQRRTRIALSQFRGKVVAISFVYTSCALPQFCLRTAGNFAALQKRFKKRLGRDLVLLTITLDPARDLPDILGKYASQWKADPATWHFLTGPVADVRRVTNLFGLDFFPDEGLLAHSVRTVFVDRLGHLMANLEGNQFNATQLGDLVQTLVER